jgi:branched-chain amino acid transport system substrate-binding protein
VRRTTILRAAVVAASVAALAGAATLAAGLSGCGSTAPMTKTSRSPLPAPSLSPIRIGVIYSLTGPQAPLDAPSLDGARLAVDRINAAGGLLGRRVELLEWDGQSDPAVARYAAQDLVDANSVAIVGLSDTDEVLAAAPVAAHAGIPFITSGATSPLLPARVPRWLFLACFGDNAQAAAGAQFAVQQLHARTAAVLYDTNSEYTRELQKYFVESFRAQGGSILLRRGFRDDASDVSTLLLRPDEQGTSSGKAKKGSGKRSAARRTHADLIYVAAGPGDAATLVRKLRAAGYRQPIMGGDSHDDDALVAAAEATGGHVWFTTHAALGISHEPTSVSEFTTAYRLAYGHPPENAFAGLGFDTVNLVAQAIATAKTTAPDALRLALLQTHAFSGVTGTLAFQRGSRVPYKEVTVVAVGRQPVVVAVLRPRKVPRP